VVGVGIAAIGPLDVATGTILEPPNVGPDIRDVAIVDPIRRRLDLPTFIERDTNVAALAERWIGAARGVPDFLYLTVSTGIGGSVVSGGRLMTGATGVAGELGHMPVDLDGPMCGCGHRGHLEAISSGSGIARAASEVAAGRPGMLRSIAAEIAPASLSAIHVARAEAAGDPDASAIMERARDAFAAAMVGFVDVFNPSLIVVGGSVARAQGDRLLDPARRAVSRHSFRRAAEAVSIVPAALGDDVSLIGCVPLVAAGLKGSPP
jgi:glucokinase